jgi:DNA-binding protein
MLQVMLILLLLGFENLQSTVVREKKPFQKYILIMIINFHTSQEELKHRAAHN